MLMNLAWLNRSWQQSILSLAASFKLFALVISVTCFVSQAAAVSVPKPLEPWLEWVEHSIEAEDPKFRCVKYNGAAEQKDCALPSRLSIKITESGAAFDQYWQLDRATWVQLPGDAGAWPVIAGRQIVRKNSLPFTYLESGVHRLRGVLQWTNGVPRQLSVPEQSALIDVVDQQNRRVSASVVSGKLVLSAPPKVIDKESKPENALSIEVYRLLKEGQLFTVETHIRLRVSGQEREVLLGDALLDGFELLSASSPLPAQQEARGLRVQIKPGEWRIVLRSRHIGEVSQLTMPGGDSDNNTLAQWPQQELWAYQADTAIRLVDLQGLPAIDPSQTNMPGAWQRFPSFVLAGGDSLIFKKRQRGVNQADNRLSLRRDVRVDFDGSGYTFTDLVSGQLNQGWRLEASPEIQLGSATDTRSNQALLITESNRAADRAEIEGAATIKGIELREQGLSIAADSRYEQAGLKLPANGWLHELGAAEINLFIPPGWSLLGVFGADSVENTGLSRWTLLDLFIVLLVIIAAWQVFGVLFSVMMAGLLVLSWHNAIAPHWLWLNLVIAWALWRAVPEGKLKSAVNIYRSFVVLVLIMVSIPFAVDQLRRVIYDSYDTYGQQSQREIGLYNKVSSSAIAAARRGKFTDNEGFSIQADEAIVAEAMTEPRPQEYSKVSSALKRLTKEPRASGGAAQAKNNIQMIDGGVIQTGPGVPTWQYDIARIRVAGPVAEGAELKVLLLRPWMMNIVHLTMVILLAGVLLQLVRGLNPSQLNLAAFKSNNAKSSSPTSNSGSQTGNVKVSMLFGLALTSILSFLVFTHEATAQAMPNENLLERLEHQLKQQEQGECRNACISFAKQLIRIDKDLLQIDIDVHADERRLVALPGDANQWLPSQVLLNGEPATGLLRRTVSVTKQLQRRSAVSTDNLLWLLVPEGIHQVNIKGAAPTEDFSLTIPTPTAITEVQASAWQVSGLQGGKHKAALQFNKKAGVSRQLVKASTAEKKPTSSKIEPSPFFELRRDLVFDQTWRIENTVRRLSSDNNSASLLIELLPGEQVVSEAELVDGKIRINFSGRDRQQQWRSILEPKHELRFSAPSYQSGQPWQESWSLKVSSLWHISTEGIPANSSSLANGYWQPLWRPWPGEQLTIKVEKPSPAAGPSLTIQQSQLHVKAGKRSRDIQLTLDLRSSVGGQHPIQLPANSKLKQVQINGRSLPLRLEEKQGYAELVLSLSPGTQKVQLEFSVPEGLTTRLETPQINLNSASVNSHIAVDLPLSRWVLFAGGSSLGPVVLIWGLLLVLVFIAYAFSQLKSLPLSFGAWLLLLVGLSQLHIISCAVVIGWLALIAYYKNLAEKQTAPAYNALQLLVGLWAVVAALVLIAAVQKGLLGLPSMHIEGNGSSANNLLWYEDRSDETLPTAWVLSVPLIAYRVMMLLWSLWLAFSVLRWVRWAWQEFSRGGLWRKPIVKKAKSDTSSAVSSKINAE